MRLSQLLPPPGNGRFERVSKTVFWFIDCNGAAIRLGDMDEFEQEDCACIAIEDWYMENATV